MNPFIHSVNIHYKVRSHFDCSSFSFQVWEGGMQRCVCDIMSPISVALSHLHQFPHLHQLHHLTNISCTMSPTSVALSHLHQLHHLTYISCIISPTSVPSSLGLPYGPKKNVKYRYLSKIYRKIQSFFWTVGIIVSTTSVASSHLHQFHHP